MPFMPAGSQPAQPEEASNMHALNCFGQRGTCDLFKQAS